MTRPITTAASRVLIALFLWAVAACSTLAQDAPVLQAPPKINFGQWREIERQEFYRKYTMLFPSAYTTGFPENDQVALKVTMPSDTFGRVPVVVLLHYYGASDTKLEDSVAEELAKSGIASVLMPLPYHLSRTPKGKLSGELAIQADLKKLEATMVQSVLDIRRTVDWIESRSEFRQDQIGISGTSLGAMVTALAFAIEDRFAASSYLLGGADIAHILWNSSRVVAQRTQLRAQGYTEDKVRTELVDIEPLTYLKLSDIRPSFVIAGRYDTVVPPADSRKLINALGGSQELWLDTGHYGGVFVQAKIVRTIARFFDGTFRGSGFTAPQSFYAPTIRWGLQLNDVHGLQVMGGLDIWKLRADGQTFSTFMLTPRGFQGYIGHTISSNLSFGITVLPKKTTWGVLWSIVL